MIYFLFAVEMVLAGAFFFMRGRSKYYSQTAVMVGDEHMFYHDLSDRAMTVAITYLQLCGVFSVLVMVAFIIPDPWELPAISASAMVLLYFLYRFYQKRLLTYEGLSLAYVKKLMRVIKIIVVGLGVLTLAMLLSSCTPANDTRGLLSDYSLIAGFAISLLFAVVLSFESSKHPDLLMHQLKFLAVLCWIVTIGLGLIIWL